MSGTFVALVSAATAAACELMTTRDALEISPRPILLIHGEKAHSRYFSETAYAAAAQPKELLIVSGASHVDLYDKKDAIPFDKLQAFFTQHLA